MKRHLPPESDEDSDDGSVHGPKGVRDLTEDEIASILQMYGEGKSCTDAGSPFEVSRKVVEKYAFPFTQPFKFVD